MDGHGAWDPVGPGGTRWDPVGGLAQGEGGLDPLLDRHCTDGLRCQELTTLHPRGARTVSDSVEASACGLQPNDEKNIASEIGSLSKWWS